MPQANSTINDIIQLVNQVLQAVQDGTLRLSAQEWQPLERDLREVLTDLSEATDETAQEAALKDLIAVFDRHDMIADHFEDELKKLTEDMKLGQKMRPADPGSPKPTKNLMTRLQESIKKLLNLSSSQQNS